MIKINLIETVQSGIDLGESQYLGRIKINLLGLKGLLEELDFENVLDGVFEIDRWLLLNFGKLFLFFFFNDDGLLIPVRVSIYIELQQVS